MLSPQASNIFKKPELFLMLLFVALSAVLFFIAPIAQDQNYHLFVDSRTMFAVPNLWNVISNVPFVVVGIWGLYACIQKPNIYFMVFFIGFFLTGFGSAYYHWAPSNATLVWDRLPMTIAFMAFFSFILSEHINKNLGIYLLLPLLILGVFSIFYWDYTESMNRGDLRLYAGVQFIPIILIPCIVMLFPNKNYAAKTLWLLVLAYLLAKVFEYFDAAIYQAIPMSGHAIKHVVASFAGIAFIYLIKSYNAPKLKTV